MQLAEPLTAGAICEPLAVQSETLGVLHLQVRQPPERPSSASDVARRWQPSLATPLRIQAKAT